VLLHGLYGWAGEWSDVASWLRTSRRVFVPDQRGHGLSKKGLQDFSRDAFVSDTVALIEHIGGPVLLIGQSMGALNALVAAARRPELVERLILIEATAWNASDEPPDDWPARWPLPFQSVEQARLFFDSQGTDGRPWAESLEERDGGYWPRFRAEDMRRIAAHLSSYDYRAECRRIVAPTLVIGGSRT